MSEHDGYGGQERRQDAVTRDSLHVKGPMGIDISVSGQFGIQVLIQLAICALIIIHARWTHDDQEKHSREWSQDVTAILASNDLVMARQQIIINAISKYCSAYYGLDTTFDEAERKRKEAADRRQKEMEQRFKPQP